MRNPKIRIPIQYKQDGLHFVHKELIEYAKPYGEVQLHIFPNTLRWGHYLKTGIRLGRFSDAGDLSMLQQDAAKLGVELLWESPVGLQKEIKVPFKDRAILWNGAYKVANSYKEKLILDRYVELAAIYLCSNKIFKIKPADFSLRGPEVHSFFVKATGKTKKDCECLIYPQIIKDSNLGIKRQSILKEMDAYMLKHVERLPYIVSGFKDRCRVGSNQELVNEVNSSYAHRPWKIMDITVFENNGIVDGRLEVIGFSFPTGRGIALVEEANYYV